MKILYCQNGWPVCTKSQTEVFTAGGTDWRTAKGDPAYTFKRFIDRYSREVENITGGVPDDWSYAERLVRDSTIDISNHGGYAVDINALRHRRGVHNTFSATQRAKLRNLLADFHVIRWGGDFKTAPVDDMHFEIIADAVSLAGFVRHLKSITPVGPSTVHAIPASYSVPIPVRHVTPVTFTRDSTPDFPLPVGSYFGPKTGPKESVSGYSSHTSDLAKFQQQLKNRGWGITSDGHYGPKTADIVKKFQCQKNLKPDGLVGVFTWNAAWEAPVTAR